MRRGCASPRCSGVPEPAAVQTPPGSLPGGPGPCRCVPLLPRPRQTRGCPWAEPAVTAPLPPPPSRAPAPALPARRQIFCPRFPSSSPSRRPQGSALLPVSERGRSARIRLPWAVSARRGAGPSEPRECLPVLAVPPSLRHTPLRAACPCFPARSLAASRGGEWA